MKILYVKHNSERAKEFQLRTIIYEINGKKYVKKQAMCKEAIPHLMKMKEHEKKLQDSIINPNVKITKIIDETEDSLVFEYIEGISLERKYQQAKKLGKEAEVTKDYITFVKTSFKTTEFNIEMMVTDSFKQILGDLDYSILEKEICFDSISNIDLLFSNIIFKDNYIYLIDYEWIYDLSIPINFTIYRALHEKNELHESMEENFIHNIVVRQNGFFNIQNQYKQERHSSILKHIDEQTQNIKYLNHHIVNLTIRMQELTIKGRLKKVLKFIFPLKMLQKLKSIKNELLS